MLRVIPDESKDFSVTWVVNGVAKSGKIKLCRKAGDDCMSMDLADGEAMHFRLISTGR